MGEGLPGVSEQHLIPADVVERPGLPEAPAGGTGQGKCLLAVGECLLGSALLLEHRAEVHVAVGLAGLVAEILEQAQGLPGVSMGLVVAAEPGTGPAEAAMGMGLPTPVSALPGGSQGGVLDGGPVVPVPPPQKELSQRPGKLPGVSGLPGGGGQLDRSEQHGTGIRSGGTWRASRKPRTASAGAIAEPVGSKPRRFTNNCPSGNRSATRCAQYTARAVLPIPAVPSIAEITTVPADPAVSSIRAVNASNSATRPAKCLAATGSCRGTGVTRSPEGSRGPARPVSRPAMLTRSARAMVTSLPMLPPLAQVAARAGTSAPRSRSASARAPASGSTRS